MSAFYRAESEVIVGESEHSEANVGGRSLKVEKIIVVIGVFVDPKGLKKFDKRS